MQIVNCVQQSAEWWAARRGVPTASNFDRIITPTGKPSASARKYACELVGDIACQHPGLVTDRPMTPAMRHGTDCEPEARRFYQFETGREPTLVGFCLTDDLRFGCSPDALVGDDGVLELKCPQPSTQAEYVLDGVLPSEYRPQVHGHLVVTGRAWCDFLSYCPGLPHLLVRVTADEYTEKVRKALDDFWSLYCETRTRMMPDRFPSTKENP